MSQAKNVKGFIDKLVSEFPEIKDEVLDEDYEGLITLQIGCFRRFTQKAIDDSNLILVGKCFRFVEDNINNVEFPIENSLTISYLGKLNIEPNSPIERLLPKELKDIIDTLHNYYQSPSNNEKFNKFIKGLKT